MPISIFATWLRIQFSSECSREKKLCKSAGSYPIPSHLLPSADHERKESRAVQRWFLYEKKFPFLLQSADCTMHVVPAHPGTSTCSCWAAPNTPIIPRGIKWTILESALGMQAGSLFQIVVLLLLLRLFLAVAAPNGPRRDFTQSVNTIWWVRTLIVWRGVLPCRCFAGSISIWFGLVCVRNWNWMGISLLQMVPWQKSLV